MSFIFGTGDLVTLLYNLQILKTFIEVDFCNDLSNSQWNILDACGDADDMLDLWYQLFIIVVDKHLPIRKVKHLSQPEWINEEIIDAIKIPDNFSRYQKIAKWKWWKIK